MKTQHTPGPWTVSPHGAVMDKRACRVATLEQMPGMDAEEQAANARLIAAAPDLLELLETVLKRLDMEHAERIAKGEERPRFICAAMREDLRAAIAKAKGTTEYDLAKQQAAAWRAKAARDDHPGRGFCLEQAERWEARAAIAKVKEGAQ